MFMGHWMWENEWRHLLPNVSRCCTFSQLHAFTLQPGLSPNNTHDLMVNFVHFHFPGGSGRASNFRPSTRLMCQHIHCQKNAPQTWCNATAEPSRRKMRDFIQATGPSFTLFFYDGGALMACERHRPRRLWEKDKRPVAGASRLEHLFSLLWFIGSIVTALLSPQC